jgi:thiol-disulfide isomerase/thioredoxin
MLRVAASIGLLVTFGAASPAQSPAPIPGEWQAWLDSPGGALRFGLVLEAGADGWSAAIRNGIERIPVTEVTIDGATLTLGFPAYDSRVTATIGASGKALDGSFVKRSGPDSEMRMAFHARQAEPRTTNAATPTASSELDGRWAVRFSSSADPAVGIFEADGGHTLRGTFLTTLGDYRYLAGQARDGTLELACFDGAHAFLFRARRQDDGSLAGDFWSRDTWHETWTAIRDDDAALPDAFAKTRWTGSPEALGGLAFPDLDGTPRRLDEFAGRARVLVVFGTWCPNCRDATALWVELSRRYAERGLSVVGLAFELTGDAERDRRQVRRYAELQGIRYPVLLCGIADKPKASQALPLLDAVRAYPTTVFLRGDGSVRAVHTGFAGPATGPEHDALRQRFTALLDELLAEDGR